MTRSYKLLSSGPHPANPLNVTTTIEVTDDVTGEVLTLTDRVFGSDLTAARLAEQIGLIEANVMGPRATAIAELKALKGATITPTAPAGPDAKEMAYQEAAAKLTELDRLVQLKVIAADSKEYTDALQAVKDAKGQL